MAKYSNTVEYNISTKLDSSGLTKLQTEIQKIELSLQKNANRGLLSSSEVEKARTQLEGLGTALTKAFNPSLGMLDLTKLQSNLKGTEVTAEGLGRAFQLAGTQGEVAFNDLIGQLGRLDTGLAQSNSALDKMFTTFSNTFRWGLVSSFFSNFMNSIHQSVDYVKELDDSLTQIMLVTDYNRDAMNQYAKSANEAAKAVSMTTTGMTNASLVFAQQGYDLNQSQELATLSAKLANASQQDTATTSDQITAYMNAYGLQDNIAELSQAMDNWALIANVSAADVSELAQASQRAASMANTVGVSGEQLAAQIATIESVTREAPEQIGNGLKTLYARFSDISAGGEDEEGVSLGDVTKQLNDLGVQVLDQFGNIRDIGDIMEDLMVVWDDLDQTSKIAAAQSLAGKYQVNRFVSLMDNSDMYREYLGATGSAATGTLDQMNQEVADSLAGRMTKLQATIEGIFNNLFSTDDFYKFIDVAQTALDLINSLTEAMGGGIPIMTALSGLFLQTFSKNISQEVMRSVQNNQLNEIRQKNAQNVGSVISQLGLHNAPSQASQGVVQYVQQGAANYGDMSEDEIRTYNTLLDEQVQAAKNAAIANKELADKILEVGAAAGIGLGEKDSIFTGDTGEINTSNLLDALQNTGKEDFATINPEEFKEASIEAGKFANIIADTVTAFDSFSQKEEATSEDLDQLTHRLDLAYDSLLQLHSAGAISDETFARMSASLIDGASHLSNWDEESQKAIEALEKLGIEALDLQTILQGLYSGKIEWDKLDTGVQQAILKVKAARDAVDNTQSLGKGFLDTVEAQKQVKGLLDVVGAVTNLTSAYLTFQNLGSIWKNENISDGEKLLQTIMALGTTIPTVYHSFELLKGSISKLSGLQQTLAMAATATATSEAAAGLGARTMAAGMGVAAGATGALATALKFLTGPLGIALSILGVLAGSLLHELSEQAKEAHEEILTTLEDAKDIQQQTQDLSSKIDEWHSKRETQGETKELAQDANALADSLKELGNEEEAAAVQLAAIKAEALGTSESFDELGQAMDKAQLSSQNSADLATIEAANAILKDRLSTTEELAAANEDLQNASLNYNLRNLAETNGMEMGILNTLGDEDLRAATLDWQSLDSILMETLPWWRSITDENERLAIALAHTGDEAQKASIQIEQLLNANSSLSESRISDYGESFNEREGITRQLESTGLSVEENLQLLVSIDDSSYETMTQDIQTVMEHLNGGEPFDVALKAVMDEQETEDYVRSQIEAYEPTDEDVDADAFKNMANYIQGADASAFEEGGMFEDISSDIQENAEALETLVEGILRYDDAVSTLTEKEEDWRNALSDGADLQSRAEAISELKETYSDFLDLGTDVSDSFAENTENLNLMAEAAAGSEEAYNQLLAAASEDIAINVYGIDESSQALQDMSNYLQSDAFRDIDIGMTIQDDAFYDALNKMAADAGWTAADMEAYLSDIGCSIDPTGFQEGANSLIEASDQTGQAEAENLSLTTGTEISSATGQATDTTEYTSAIANVTSVTGTSTLPVTAGNLGTLSGGQQVTPVSVPYSIPSVEYTAVPITKTDVSEKTGYAIDQKVEQGKGQSGVQVKPGSVRKTGSGGTKNRNASAPRSSGGGGGKGSCFVAGTPISMLGYYKNIEEIQVNDIVLSYNEKTKTPEFSKVLQTMVHDVVEPIYTLHIKNEQLRVTGIHKFFTTDNIANPNPWWMCAENLCVGDWVLFADNTWHVIHKIEINIEHQTVYNFEVSNNHNYYVGYNQILAHNKGGGGGGSKAKTIEPKEKKSHQKDYYEEVNSQLDKTEKILSKIEKEEDRLIGDKARANQNKQLELLQKEIDLNKEKQKIQQQELKDIDAEIKEQDRLAESMAKTGGVYASIPDAVFDEDGIVANYEQISAAIDNIHNKLIDTYNAAAAAGNEDLTKSLSKTIEKFDKYGENILKSAQRHNKLQTEIEGTINELEQLQDAIEDVRIDAWKESTEAIDNLKDLRETAAELEGFFSEYESDSPFRDLIVDSEKLNNIWSIGKDEAKAYYDEIIADKEKALKAATNEDERAAIKMSIDYFKALRDNLSDTGLNNGLLGLAYQDMLQLKEWFENPNAADNPFGQNVSALRDAYEEAYNKVADMSKEYEKQVEDFRDHMIDAYDDIEDRQDRQIDKFDRVVEKLEQFSDMYALYYGDESYDMLRDTLQQQGNTLREQLNLQKELYSYWADKYAEAIEIGDEKLMNELEDKMNDAEDKMAELAEDAAKAFADSYENAVKASTQHIIQGTIGDKNFDRLDRNWEWDKDYIDQYRDNVEKAYEMDKLRDKYTDLLNQAQGASLQTQDKIRAQMQEQLALLDGQATVSEYDVKLANAKLEILQKQIALEDAQRNKNQMKLRRDTQGNYRYVYTANQDDVSGAQQDLLDSEYDAYELSKNQQMNNYDNLINAYQKYLSQREEILNNANLSEQEKLDQNAELYDKFLKVVDAAREDFSDAAYGTLDILNWLTLNGTDYTTTAAIDMLNKLLDEQGNIKDETGIIWMDNATYLTDEVIPKISDAVGAADDDIKNRLNELEQNMVGDNGVIPTIVNGIEGEDGLTAALDEAKTSTDGLVVATRDLMEALNGDNGALAEAQAQLQNYLEELNNVKNASSITAQQLRDTQKELDKSQAESLNYKTQLDDLASGKKVIRDGKIVDPNAEKKNGGSGSKSSTANSGKAAGVAAAIWIDGGWASGWGDGWERAQKLREKGVSNAQDILNRDAWSGKIYDDWYGSNLRPYYYGSFKSGGYTGEWTGIDSEKNGKLAFLHQKELILNAEDTQNILAAVDIVRQMGIGLRNSTININGMSGKNLGTIGDTIEQRVEITASFPNATDAEDIRQALIGLSDKAYQYAHRNR